MFHPDEPIPCRCYSELVTELNDEVVKHEDSLSLVTWIKTSHKAATYDVSGAYGHHENIFTKCFKIYSEDVSWSSS